MQIKDRRGAIMMFYLIALFVIIVDQLSKYLIRTYMNINDYTTLWGIPLTHYENSGMAGSLLQGYGRLFGIVAVLFVIGVVYYRRKGILKGWINEISLGFLVGGAAGNGVDRIFYGQVTDFLVSRSGHGVLNMADHAIEIGTLLFLVNIVLDQFRNWKMKPKKERVA
jgi:signal peptidase II